MKKFFLFLCFISIILIGTGTVAAHEDVCNTTVIDKELVMDDVINNNALSDLELEISHLSSGDVYNFDKDYYSDCDDDRHNAGIQIYTDNITLNGNGHKIDGMNNSAIFAIYGNNVKIHNLTIANSHFNEISLGNYVIDRSPIFWQGDNGVISNCVFSGNSAINGGAIKWMGDNGIINQSIFINNTALGVGGAIDMGGVNNTIAGPVFINSISRLSGETVYMDPNRKNCSYAAHSIAVKLLMAI